MEQKNVILVYPDQYRYDCASFLGHPQVKTPALDELAGESTVFSQAFTSFPLCSPFRASLMTGVYAHKNGMWANHIPIDLNQTFLPELMGQAGYRTCWVGKWHLNGGNKFDHVPKEYQLGFDEFIGYSRGHKYQQSLYYINDDPTPRTSPRFQPEYQTDQLIDFIDRAVADNKPFMGMIGYGIPHPPVHDLPEEYKIFAPEDIQLPDTVPEWERERSRKFCANYYSMIARVDHELGKLIRHLKEKDLWQNTIFIFVSDHGELRGEHGLWDKRSVYRSSMQVPLLIHVPGKESGMVEQLVDASVDLTPTILDYCGLEIPDHMQGRSLRTMIETGSDAQHNDYVYYELMGIEQGEWNARAETEEGNQNGNIRRAFAERGIRTKKWVYVEKMAAPFALYDLEKDPDETINLVTHTGYIDTVLALQAQLRKVMEETGDDWAFTVDGPPKGYQAPSVAKGFFQKVFPTAVVDDKWMNNEGLGIQGKEC